ncbi:MAG: hypothetical protein J3K34DRAFT_29469 [Monoraphidium minutum]|nr:MAG: hypothetical protein J3K34DRAFT_29469 [Monoraphidium minutum]
MHTAALARPHSHARAPRRPSTPLGRCYTSAGRPRAHSRRTGCGAAACCKQTQQKRSRNETKSNSGPHKCVGPPGFIPKHRRGGRRRGRGGEVSLAAGPFGMSCVVGGVGSAGCRQRQHAAARGARAGQGARSGECCVRAAAARRGAPRERRSGGIGGARVWIKVGSRGRIKVAAPRRRPGAGWGGGQLQRGRCMHETPRLGVPAVPELGPL